MKNNELTEVKPVMPSLEELPQEVIEYVHGLVAERDALAKLVNAIATTAKSITRNYVSRLTQQSRPLAAS